jgi:small Trp-rich protein
MAFLVLGIFLVLMKWAEIGPVATWSWWWVLAPFGLAAAWWAWADSSGYTQRQAMEKERARREQRLARARERIKRPSARP